MLVNGSATQNTFVNAEGGWYQTGFDYTDIYPCEDYYGSVYSTWVGMGGWNSPRLIQAGTDVGTSQNAVYAFMEVEDDPGSPRGQMVPSGGPYPNVVNPGDNVHSYVAISTSYLATMTVTDISSGAHWTIAQTTFYGNRSDVYYDGTTAEYITEPDQGGDNGPYPDGTYHHPLRKPHLNNTKWYYAVANGSAIANYSSWVLNQIDGDPSPQQTSTWDGVHAWYNNYGDCT